MRAWAFGILIRFICYILTAFTAVNCAETQQTSLTQTCARNVSLIDRALSETQYVFSTGHAFAQGLTLTQKQILSGIMIKASIASQVSLAVTVFSYTDSMQPVYAGDALLQFNKTVTSVSTVTASEYWIDFPSVVELDPASKYFSIKIAVTSGSIGFYHGTIMSGSLFHAAYAHDVGLGWQANNSNAGITMGLKFDKACVTPASP